MLKIKIYSGLSLKEAVVKKYLPTAIFSRPVKRNEIYDDIKNGVHIIGIIDGEFLQNLSVSPTEIRDAMRCGLSVYGSSSMGAMRAAELLSFGMIGCGRIYEQISRDPYFRDDKLGQIFYEGTDLISLPFMDFFLGMEDLVERKIVSRKDSNEVVKYYEDLHFADRNYAALRAQILKRPNKENLLDVLHKAKKSIVSQKSKDGVLLVKRIVQDIKENQLKLRRLQ